jgi:hypothetical protein
MIRNLKVLMLAAMALAAIGVVNAAGAQAAVEFHCSVSPCTATLKTDGTGKTAHHVYVLKNNTGESNAITCEDLSGHATSATTTAATLNFTNLIYSGCKDSFGNAVTVDMNGCEFEVFAASGILSIVNCTEKAGVADPIEVTIITGCVAKISEQALGGLSFHSIGEEAKNTTEVTVEAKVPNIVVKVTGTKAQCGIDPTKTPITSEYTTGNTLATAETDPGSAMANSWWK